MAKQRILYANVELTNGTQLQGEISSLYTLKEACDMLTACKPDTVVLIGDYLAFRAGDFSNCYVTCKYQEEVQE